MKKEDTKVDDLAGMPLDDNAVDRQWKQFQELYGDTTEDEKRRPSKASLALLVALVVAFAAAGVAGFLNYF